jgi:hypothetical protein
MLAGIVMLLLLGSLVAVVATGFGGFALTVSAFAGIVLLGIVVVATVVASIAERRRLPAWLDAQPTRPAARRARRAAAATAPSAPPAEPSPEI